VAHCTHMWWNPGWVTTSLDISQALGAAERLTELRSSRPARVFKDTGRFSVANATRRLIHSTTRHLKYRAKLTPPLRGEEATHSFTRPTRRRRQRRGDRTRNYFTGSTRRELRTRGSRRLPSRRSSVDPRLLQMSCKSGGLRVSFRVRHFSG